MQSIHIRPATFADAEAIGRVHVDSWRAAYRGIVPDAKLDSLSYDEHTVRWQGYLADGNALIALVAETAEGHIVGFASGGRGRGDFAAYTGELYAIYLDPSYTGHGIGTRLTRALAAALRDKGHRSMVVWVLADNPARHFYAALGGEFVADATIDIGGATLVEWAYGWRNIDALAGNQST